VAVAVDRVIGATVVEVEGHGEVAVSGSAGPPQ